MGYAYDGLGQQSVASGAGYQRALAYTVEQQVQALNNASQTSRFWYGPDGHRYKHEETTQGLRRTLYLGAVEWIDSDLELVPQQGGNGVLEVFVGEP